MLFFLSLQILMPVFPGQLRYIRKNLFHAVFVLDPGSTCGLEASLYFVSIRVPCCLSLLQELLNQIPFFLCNLVVHRHDYFFV